MTRHRPILCTFAAFLLLADANVGRAQELRVKLIVTFSESPNDQFATPQSGVRAIVGTQEVVTGDDGVVRTTVPPGPTVIRLPPDVLGDPPAYRVGYVSIAPTNNGVVRRCAPNSLTGDVVFVADLADAFPSSQSDYEVGIRGVPIDAEAVTDADDCSAPATTTTTLPPFCPAVPGSRFGPLVCAGPTITSLVVPPTIWADRTVPFQLTYSSPDGVKAVTLQQKSPSTGKGKRNFDRESVFPVDYPKGQGTFSVEGISCAFTTATLPNGQEVPEFDEWWNTHQVRATIMDARGATSRIHNARYVCIRKPRTDRILGAIATLAAGGATVAALASLGPGAALWVTLTTGITGGAATVTALVSTIKLDPPDPNYQTVPVPLPPSIPPVNEDDEVTPDLAGAANALADNYAELAGLEKAFLQALERAQGAGDAQNLEWYTTQTNTAIQLAAQWATALESLPAATGRLADAWRASGNPDVVISPDDVRDFQDDIAINGLPLSILDVLDQLDDDGRLYENVLDLLLNQDPAVVAGNVVEKLNDSTLTSAVNESVEDLRRVFGSSGLCDAALCDDGDACTAESCTADGCEYATSSGCSQTACVADGECEDGDPCTDDVCAANLCAFNAVTGDRFMACAFAYSLTPPECQGAKVPGAIAKKFTLATQSANRLASGTLTQKQRARAIKKANGAVKKALLVLKRAEVRKKNPLPPACVASLRAVLTNAQAHLAGGS